jgi:hypothetical protein
MGMSNEGPIQAADEALQVSKNLNKPRSRLPTPNTSPSPPSLTPDPSSASPANSVFARAPRSLSRPKPEKELRAKS